MTSANSMRKQLRERRGAIAVIVGILMVSFLGFAALAVDVGYIMVTKNELQNVADAAALAGARTLGRLYECNGDIAACPGPMSYSDQLTYVADAAVIRQASIDAAASNKAGGISIAVNSADIVIGRWNTITTAVKPTLNSPDAVGVVARRDSQANNPVATFFARIFNTDTVAVSTAAAAALTAQSTAGPGDLIPVGISEEWFRNKDDFCNQNIRFSPTNSPEGCAGWNTFDHWPASESYLRKTILEGWYDGVYAPPGATVGDEFVFTGGSLGDQTFEAFQNLYDKFKDPATGIWETKVVVYKSDSCSNPSGGIEIVGFATALVSNVIPPPDKTIEARVICNNIAAGRGSGNNYGTKGSIPGLVR